MPMVRTTAKPRMTTKARQSKPEKAARPNPPPPNAVQVQPRMLNFFLTVLSTATGTVSFSSTTGASENAAIFGETPERARRALCSVAPNAALPRVLRRRGQEYQTLANMRRPPEETSVPVVRGFLYADGRAGSSSRSPGLSRHVLPRSLLKRSHRRHDAVGADNDAKSGHRAVGSPF